MGFFFLQWVPHKQQIQLNCLQYFHQRFSLPAQTFSPGRRNNGDASGDRVPLHRRKTEKWQQQYRHKVHGHQNHRQGFQSRHTGERNGAYFERKTSRHVGRSRPGTCAAGQTEHEDASPGTGAQTLSPPSAASTELTATLQCILTQQPGAQTLFCSCPQRAHCALTFKTALGLGTVSETSSVSSGSFVVSFALA